MTVTRTTEWLNHTRAKPCPICGKPDRCQFTQDGAHRCFRIVEEVPGWRKVATCTDGTIVFRPTNGTSQTAPTAFPRSRRTQQKKNARHNWAIEAAAFSAALTDDRLQELARSLSVTADSLKAIDCGWAEESDLKRLGAWGTGWDKEYPVGAYAFPERSGDGSIIGLLLRAEDGRKGAPKGCLRGLIIPVSLTSIPGPVLVVEGPSDVAACLSMGLAAVGRPNNCGGSDRLADLLRDRDVIVVGENDSRLMDGGQLLWPGRDGAESVSRGLAAKWQRPVQWSLPPKNIKDVRAWLNGRYSGLTDDTALLEAGRAVLDEVQATAETIHPAPPEVSFSIEQRPGRTSASITARIDGQLVAVDSFNPASEKRRTKFVESIVAKDGRLNQADVEAALLDAVTPRLTLSQSGTGANTDAQAPPTRESLLAKYDEHVQELLDKTPAHVVEAAEAMLRDPHMLNRILEDYAEIGVVGEQELSLTIHTTGTSRLLHEPDHPLGTIVNAPSATGKSFTIEKSASLFPSEALVRCTDMTPQAMFYMKPGSLIHRFVVVGERFRRQDDERADANRALREMLSSGRLSKAVPIKVNGRYETAIVEQDGPIAYVDSTTLTTLFDEDANRCLLVSTDESPEQTARILADIAGRASTTPKSVQSILDRHHAMQRMLRRLRVTVPFATALANEMPYDRPEARRAISHTLGVIKAVALLHQRQRSSQPLQHGDTIAASVNDYRIARRLLLGPLGRSLGGALPDAATRLAHRLRNAFGDEPFAASQAAARDPIIRSRTKICQYLSTLHEAGVTELLSPSRGNQPAIWRIIADPPPSGARWLPEGDALEGSP